MKALFINGSPNRDGNTARLAGRLLKGQPYETVNLLDYRIGFYGQDLPDDQFDEILQKIEAADTVVIGSPVYWHNMCASVRNLLDRFYGPVEEGSMRGKKLYFVFQGAAPTREMLQWGGYTMKRFAEMFGFTYMGEITNARDI
jgi:multimeric flavodoxin WrbA